MTEIDLDLARAAVRDLLKAIGEDPDRDGLIETPDRVARMWRDFLTPDTARLSANFAHTALCDQLVLVKGVRVTSFCEHHLLPFWATMAVAYIPRAGTVLGLSKIPRICRHHASRLQLQERLVEDIADDVANRAGTSDVAVLADEAVHTCMTCRGVEAREATMTTSALRGVFRDDPKSRAEFLALARTGH